MFAEHVYTINPWAVAGALACVVLICWWLWMRDRWDSCPDCDRERSTCSCVDVVFDPEWDEED